MINLKDAWNNKNVFNKQLSLNLRELSDNNLYPEHWIDFINLVLQSNASSILDVGCGCGAIYQLCRNELPNIRYYGCDFSHHAIELAKKQWSNDDFFVFNLFDLTKETASKYDLVHFGAVLDVLPNGDEALEFCLSLNIKNIILGRMKLTEFHSYYNSYKAYDEITTCEYFHNIDNFKNLCIKNNYSVVQSGSSFLLSKHD